MPLIAPKVKSYIALFNSKSKYLDGKYRREITDLASDLGFDAKFVVSASASMVPGVPREHVWNLAKARATTVKSLLLKLGVKNSNISLKYVVNRIGQALATKVQATKQK